MTALHSPPAQIDGAHVLAWAWSAQPFGSVASDDGTVAIHGLAICRYAHDARVYRFSCDAQWTCWQDQVYDSVAEAQAQLPQQYRAVAADWQAI